MWLSGFFSGFFPIILCRLRMVKKRGARIRYWTGIVYDMHTDNQSI